MIGIEKRYQDGSYMAENPDWDRGDSPWKVQFVQSVLADFNLKPSSVCEVGCGAGDNLVHLKKIYPDALLVGYDISPDAARLWKEHEGYGIHFYCGDFLALNQGRYDLILLLDVIEHLSNPFNFLEKIRDNADYYIFHIPLDLSAINVAREKPILKAREKVGHIHYYTKNLALSLLRECGYNIVKWSYSGATFNSPQRSLKTKLASVPRRFAYILNKDLGVRIFGGETLFVLAINKDYVDR